MLARSFWKAVMFTRASMYGFIFPQTPLPFFIQVGKIMLRNYGAFLIGTKQNRMRSWWSHKSVYEGADIKEKNREPEKKQEKRKRERERGRKEEREREKKERREDARKWIMRNKY